MFYYGVLVASSNFHGNEALTYSYDKKLLRGQLVKIPLRQKQVLGVVSQSVKKPAISIKSIITSYSLPPIPEASLELLGWLQTYYPAPLGLVTQQFLPKTLSKILVKSSSILASGRTKSTPLPPLTPEQKNVLKAMDTKVGSFLLHGETGSGKTRIYLELARRELLNNRSAIILTPEISLTSQLTTFFREHIDGPVILLHSQLTETERRNCWLAILQSKDPLVVIGPRSALFAPIKNLGLIVVDEAHENGYKQEQAPRYSAQRVASQLALLHHALLVMGSATPSVSDYFIAQAKHVPILRMESLARKEMASSSKAEPKLIDLKDRGQFTQSNYISDPLVQAIGEALKRHEQSLLFLNRRGTARVIACQNCGWQALCPNCDLPLTYHGDSHRSLCHVCGHQQATPTNCPKCSSLEIVFKSIGTKAIVNEAQRLFPNARVKRFDNDNKKADSFSLQYETVKVGNVDIMVGTQTLAKGLDLPRLSVLGVIIADTSLYLPDYTANEHTYQLLYQVIGRVSRGHIAGKAFIQSYDPTNPTIQAASKREWDSFYKSQLSERQVFLFPPFCFLLKLTCRRVSSASAETAAAKLIDRLSHQQLKIQIIGPSPAFHEKAAGKSQWQVVVKSKRRDELLKVISLLPAGWSYDIDPTDLL
jgi:primosomal protein N' (replication factor Y)